MPPDVFICAISCKEPRRFVKECAVPAPTAVNTIGVPPDVAAS